VDNLYAGLAGATLVRDHFDLGRDVIVSRTYAHFMAPFLMAFSPASPGKPHPAPWKPARGGLGIDITAELSLPATTRLEHIDHLNAIWWIVALLRLKATSSLFVPVISNERFASIPIVEQEPELMPIEIYPRLFASDRSANSAVTFEDLQWLADNWEASSKLLRNEDFNVAFQAVDSSLWNASPALALVSVWGALERLFSFSTQELSFRVSAHIAAYLEMPGRGRHKCFEHVKGLYNHRSKAAHGSVAKDALTAYQETFAIARRVLLRMIESRKVPDKRELEANLFGDPFWIDDVGATAH